MADELSEVLPKLTAALEGRYTVERELGRGGMATVFLAHDVKHGREVAIKVLHPELAATVGGGRFEREIRLLARLQHPHILGMFDSGEAGGLLYYVMPFVKGESLRDRIEREGMLPIEDAIQITLEVNDALGYAHKQGIVHRDIKPENILLTGGHALVADFGIAKLAEDQGGQKLTQTGMSMGTPYYMAPEQSSGEPAGPTSDIYALGCVLYEMLAGEPPFTGKNAMQIMARHAMEQVPSVRIVRNVVPEEIENAIFIAMNKSPADRPQSAEQFAQLLGLPLGSTASMRALTPTMQRRIPSGAQAAIAAMQKPWWKRPALVGAAAFAVLAGVAAVYYAKARGNGRFATSDPNARRIAVLYFQDRSRDSSLGPLADGLTEGLIHSLSSAPTLTVISRSGVEPFRGTGVAPDSIARALRAGYLVRGDVEPEGDQVRVTVRLDDASGANIDRATFTRPASNQVAMRDTLVVLASDLIRRQLREDIQLKMQRASTASADAWLLQQRAEQQRKAAESARRAGDGAAYDRELAAADSLLVLAAKADPKWADPPTLRAQIAYGRSRVGGATLPQVRQWTGVAEDYATQALALDANDADALEVRGNAKYWRWLKGLETSPEKAQALLLSAKADLEQAKTVNPNQAGAWASLSHLYYQTGNATDINIAAQRALEADEFLSNAEVILNRLFLSSYDLGQFDRADQRCGELRQRYPAGLNSVRCQLYLLTGTEKAPDVGAAWKLADSAVALVPAPAKESQRLNTGMLVAAVIARGSKSQPALADSARHVARRSEGTAANDPTRETAWSGAFVYTLLGDDADAVRLLKSYIAANPQRAKGLRDEPGWWFRDLERNPQYRQLVGLGS
ncbi:MAG: serine/threonine-protein kinase [Gemmatimonadota bacterium]|nr:serine/threonine-protein kinase [Gemmatimonadota bacterium]